MQHIVAIMTVSTDIIYIPVKAYDQQSVHDFPIFYHLLNKLVKRCNMKIFYYNIIWRHLDSVTVKLCHFL